MFRWSNMNINVDTTLVETNVPNKIMSMCISISYCFKYKEKFYTNLKLNISFMIRLLVS